MIVNEASSTTKSFMFSSTVSSDTIQPLVELHISWLPVPVDDATKEPGSIKVDHLRGGLGGEAVAEHVRLPVLSDLDKKLAGVEKILHSHPAK